ncbi:Type-1 restriction enzyme EcoKI specificity protein [compost metagenome]
MSRDVPEGWTPVRLGALVEIERANFSIDEINSFDSVRLYSLPAFDIAAVPEKIAGSEVLSNKYRVPADCILFSKLNPRIPRVWRVKHEHLEPALGSTEFWPLTPINGNVDLDFLTSFLTSGDFLNSPKITPASSTNSHQRVDRKAFENFEMLLPPLHEQRRIAETLSSVDEAIAATRAVIEQTRKVKQCVLERLLTKGIGHTRFKHTEIGEIPDGWDLMRLRDLAVYITSGSRGWAQFYSEEGDLFLRSQNVRNGALDLSDKQFVTVPKNAEGSRTLVQANDLVFTITGNSVGNVAIIPADFGNAYVSQHVALVRLKDRQLSDFLSAFFSPSGPGNSQILSAQYGQSKPGLSLENVRSFHVPVPPYHELAQLTEIVKNQDVYEMSLATELAHLISLKSALMFDLLSGRKRVTDALPMAAE